MTRPTMTWISASTVFRLEKSIGSRLHSWDWAGADDPPPPLPGPFSTGAGS